MKIIYNYNDSVSVAELFELIALMKLDKSELFPAHNVFHCDLRNTDKEKIALDNSISVTARNKEGKLVGYLRIITDNTYIYYILDVMVAPSYRKKGIGSKLVDIALNKSKEDGFMKIFLTALPGKENFYQKFGFKEGMSPVLTMRGEDYIE